VKKVGLYILEMISPWGCNFWMGGLAYNRYFSAPDFKVGNKVFVKAQFFQTT